VVVSRPDTLVQPRNHDTGPGLLFSLLGLERRDPWATVAFFPSDHYIREHRAFLSHIARAIALVHHFPTKIVLLGMTPDRPEWRRGSGCPARARR
jgi:mannose-1-phosphate guanylyltransferase